MPTQQRSLTQPAWPVDEGRALLSAAVFINFVDRGNFAAASPLLKDEFGLTNSQIGLLLSAFFWSYTPPQPVAGWLAQRDGVRYVPPAGLALWALATIISGPVTGFALLLVLRVMLGISDSVTYPCNAEHRYNFPTEISGIRQLPADLQGEGFQNVLLRRRLRRGGAG